MYSCKCKSNFFRHIYSACSVYDCDLTLHFRSHESFYVQAQRVRRLVADDFSHAFHTLGVDALLTPTAPDDAPTLATASSQSVAAGFATDVFTVPSSLAGKNFGSPTQLF